MRYVFVGHGVTLCMTLTQRLPAGSNRFKLARDKPRVLTSLEDFPLIEADWSQLAAESAPMVQPAWMRAAAETLCRPGALQIVPVYRHDQLVALAPLERRAIHGLPQLVSVSVRQIYEPVDCPCADEVAAAELAKALQRLGRPILLNRLPAQSLLLAALRNLQHGQLRLVERPQASCPYITLDPSWLEAESHFNSGRRSDFRRSRKRAEQLGTVMTRIITPTAEELPNLMAEALRVEASSWKGEAGTALALDATRAAFFRRYTQLACEQGILRLCFLDIGQQTVAMQIAVQTSNAFWLLKIGYDPTFAPASPGMLLMRETIRHAVEQRLARYEFLGKSETWTDVWTKEKHECLSVQIYPYRPASMLALGLNGAASLAHALSSRRRSRA